MKHKPYVLLIHGFLGDSTMWQPLVKHLESKYLFITPDLPGHGSAPASAQRMEEFAAEIEMQLETDTPCFIIGHSMGGYVGCMLAALYPQRVRGLCLFHSTAAADSEATKQDRLRAIGLASENKDLYVRQVLGSLYSESTRTRHQHEIEEQIKTAQRMSAEAVQNSLRAMMHRPDQRQALRHRHFPLYYFLGDEDSRLPIEQMRAEVAEMPGAVAHIARHTGHMGHIECPTEAGTFIERILRAHP